MSQPSPSTQAPIADHALLSDARTAALVTSDGRIDWLCLPRFDSEAVLTSLLGTADHGEWMLRPRGITRSHRQYLPDSLVLRTEHAVEHAGATGTLELTEFMPLHGERADLIRTVRCTAGRVTLDHTWTVRMAYGAVRPWVRRDHDPRGREVLVAVAGPDKVVLHGDRLPTAEGSHHRDVIELAEGDELCFSLTWVPAWREIPPALDASRALRETVEESRRWMGCLGPLAEEGAWAPAVRRSVQVLRGLTHDETGGIVAAPTTSLPETIGGERNWDYRYTWLRDAAFTVEALLACGALDEVEAWRTWLLRAVAGDPEDLQIMYGVDGRRRLTEHELDHLPGHAGSTPVRIGNGAFDQVQTDVLGEVMYCLEQARRAGLEESSASWALQVALVNHLAAHWQEPDNGLWEIRGPRQHFTHSRVMVWAAFDAAVKGVEDHGLPGPVETWRRLRDEVRDEVLDRGWNQERQSFRQHYETDEVDAALLMLPMVGFLPADDPRVLATIRAVQEDLGVDGLVLRYRTETGVDGLQGEEHPFLICNFWLVIALAAAGQREEADALMARLVGVANDLGLLAEEYDPLSDTMMGNFPQAFSHIGVVLAARALGAAT